MLFRSRVVSIKCCFNQVWFQSNVVLIKCCLDQVSFDQQSDHEPKDLPWNNAVFIFFYSGSRNSLPQD